MKYFDIPMFVLLVATIYLCAIYLGLGLVKRLARRKDKPLDTVKTVPPTS